MKAVGASILVLFALLWAWKGFAQNNAENFIIKHQLLSVENGVASREVYCVAQDKDGFLWFGTRNGLDRFDGRNFRLFTSQRNNMQDNKVMQLATDSGNHLFIQYSTTGSFLAPNGHIDVMDLHTYQVRSLTSAFPGMPFKESEVTIISNDGMDNVFFVTLSPLKVWSYNTKAGFHLKYEIEAAKSGMADSGTVTGYFYHGSAAIFVSGGWLAMIWPDTTEIFNFNGTDRMPVYFTARHELLTAERGFKNLRTLARNSSAMGDPYKAHALDMLAGKEWDTYQAFKDASSIFAHEGQGVYVRNDNNLLKVLSPAELEGLDNAAYFQYFVDRGGINWICTSIGIVKIKIEKNRFAHYFTNNQQNAAARAQARGIYVDSTGSVYANLWNYLMVQQGDATKYYFGNMLMYALTKHNGQLYIGGFYIFTLEDLITRAPPKKDSPYGETWTLCSINDSLLLAGRSRGITLMNTKNDQDIPVNYLPVEDSAVYVYHFLKSRDRLLWAAADNGLYYAGIPVDGFSMLRLPTFARQVLQGVHTGIHDVFEDGNGIFWLATNGEGLYRWDRKTNSLKQFSLADGFPSSTLYCIESDNANNLWISTDNGLVKFSLSDNTVYSYTTKDGLSNNEFDRVSSFKAADGRIFFGGMDGVNAFYPKDFVSDTTATNIPLRIISYSKFSVKDDKLMDYTQQLTEENKIVLQPGESFFNVAFRLLDYEDAPHYYSYFIEGSDKQWNLVADNNIRISGLPYGNFTLKIKAQNINGQWNRDQLSIPITVLKPFYLQDRFIIICVFLLGALVWFISWYRTRLLRRDKERLERTVSERTEELKQTLGIKEGLLAEKEVLMKEIHHRVKNNLQVISSLLDLQSSRLDDGSAKAAIDEGKSRVLSIAILHHQLYQHDDVSKVELASFANELMRQVLGVFKKASQQVDVSLHIPETFVDIDAAVPLGLILNELLTNSFKYAFSDNGVGRINIGLENGENGECILLYRDNGPGLAKDFDLKKAKSLGLRLVSQLSRQLRGYSQYQYNNGAEFSIHFSFRSEQETSHS